MAGFPPAGAEWWLRGVSIPDDLTGRAGAAVDVCVRGEVIQDVCPAATVEPDVADRQPTGLDLPGYLLLPAPAEPHAHLDKAYTADLVDNPGGDLGGAVTAWLRYRTGMTGPDVVDRAVAAVRGYVANGATAVRTHVDVGAGVGLRALAAVLEVRERLRDECAVQVVAFVGVPLTGAAGADHRVMLREALTAGADVVGGVPAFDPDPAGCVAECLAAAAEAGVPVDLHIDEVLDPDVCTLDILARRVLATGFPYPVVASHCVSLGVQPAERSDAVAARVAAAGIAVVCLPQTNLYLQARDVPVATPRGLTALGALRAAGVTVAAGGDNVQDPFNCLGRADPLETAGLMVTAGHLTPVAAYAAVSTISRRVLGLPADGVKVGAPAELLAIRAGSVREAVAAATADRVVVHRGRVVARSTVTREFPAADTTRVAAGAVAHAPERAVPEPVFRGPA